MRHNLFDIIAMTIAGVIANCDGWYEIEDFVVTKKIGCGSAWDWC